MITSGQQTKLTLKDFCDSLLKDLDEVKKDSPKSSSSILELESNLTNDEFKKIIADLGNDSKTIADEKSLERFVDFLAKRWQRIQGTGHTYFNIPYHPTSQLCLILADKLSPYTGKGRYNLMVPPLIDTSISTLEDIHKIPLDQLILSSDQADLIHIPTCLQAAKEDGIYKHTCTGTTTFSEEKGTYVHTRRENLELTQGELEILRNHSDLTRKHCEAVAELNEKKKVDKSIGGFITRLAIGLDAGSIRKLGEKAEHNAGKRANEAIATFGNFVNVLTQEEKDDLSKRTAANCITFGEICHRLFNPEQPIAGQEQSSIYCLYLLVPDIQKIINANLDLMDKFPKILKSLEAAKANADLMAIFPYNVDEVEKIFSELQEVVIAIYKDAVDSAETDFENAIQDGSYRTQIGGSVKFDEAAQYACLKKIRDELLVKGPQLNELLKTDKQCSVFFAVLDAKQQSMVLDSLTGETLRSLFKDETSIARFLSSSLREGNKFQFIKKIDLKYVLSHITKLNTLAEVVQAIPPSERIAFLLKVIGTEKFNTIYKQSQSIQDYPIDNTIKILKSLSTEVERTALLRTFCEDKLDKLIVPDKIEELLLCFPKHNQQIINWIYDRLSLPKVAALIESDTDFSKIIQFASKEWRVKIINAIQTNLDNIIDDGKPDLFVKNFLNPLVSTQQEIDLLKNLTSGKLQTIAHNAEGVCKLLCKQRPEVQKEILQKLEMTWLKTKFKTLDALESALKAVTVNGEEYKMLRATLQSVLNLPERDYSLSIYSASPIVGGIEAVDPLQIGKTKRV
ncbi:MAG: hypothetical protein ACYCQI_11170 [Gammaproteobacteria bacterium]